MKHEKATRLNRAGAIPVYDYRGIKVVSSAGTEWGRGWIFVDPRSFNTRYSTTLEGAKFDIDMIREEVAA
jgi:hypothetical protein